MLHLSATRRAFMISAAALGASALSRTAFADTYPSRPVRIVLPLGPGGVGDISARIVADKLSDKLGQRFFIENQPSPDGLIAGRTVLNAAPDGYTLLLLTGGIASSIPQYKEFPLDMKSLVPISSMGYFDCLMVVNAKSDFQNLGDFLKAANAKPGQLNVGTIIGRRRAEPHRQLFQAGERRQFRHRAVPHHARHGRGADARRRADGGRFLRRAEVRVWTAASCAPSPGPGPSRRRRCRTCRPRRRKA